MRLTTMDAKDAIKYTFHMSRTVVKSYIADLEDTALMCRPHPGCNHIAWQLGHIIASEVQLLESVSPGSGIELPEGFVEHHAKENTGSDDRGHFLNKEQYLALLEKLQVAVYETLEATDESEMDKPGPEFLKGFADTVGEVFVLIANHPMMHAGQWVPIRRQFDQPIVI
ncbi:MAG: DinB family protein [Planctomycetota bacterium]